MARWTTTIGDVSGSSIEHLTFRPSPRPLIPTDLTDGGGVAYFGQISVSAGSFGRQVNLRTTPIATGSLEQAGPDLTDTFELADDGAVVISAGSLTFSCAGPRHSSNASSDNGEEPYDWEPASSVDIQAFITAFRALSQADQDATTVTLDDGVSDPVLTIARDLSTVVEGTDATWTITADTAPSSDLTVNVAVTESGSYIDGTAPSTVTLPSGDTEVTLTVPTDDDSTDETDGSITATLETGTGYTLGSTTAATITVTDDDVTDLLPTFGSSTVADQSYTDGTAISTLQLPAATSGDTPLVYSVSTLPGGLSFNSSTRRITGTPTTPGTTTVTYTVTDDDGDTATLSFDIVVNPTINSIDDQTGEAIRALITTGAGAFWYDRINNANIGTPSADSDLDFTDTVSVSRFRYHPTGNEFRTNVSTGQALDFFGPGAVGENSTLHIATPYGVVETTGPDDVDDRFRVTFVLTDAQYALLGNVVEGDLFNIVIAGFTEPPDPEIEIAAGTTPVTEGKDATWTVTADTAPSADLVVGVDVTETGDTIDGTAPTSVTIASGATTATLIVSTLDDSIDETDSVITATVETGTGYTVGANNSATVTVEDDDLPPDLMPTFGSEAVADQTYTQNIAISTLQLPAATGGRCTFNLFGIKQLTCWFNFYCINAPDYGAANRNGYADNYIYGDG